MLTSNKMTAHEPIKYLDSVLNEEEKRREYSHEWRNFTISRSGRFKSKNKKRDTVDRKLFDASENVKEQDMIAGRQTVAASSKDCKTFQTTTTNASSNKIGNYKSYCETNL